MPRIKQLNDETLAQCIGVGNPNASDGVLFRRDDKMHLNDNQRTLLIGLGGSGVRTINRVKSMIAAKFTDYQGRIGFLAIDTDSDDLSRMNALREDEKHVIKTEGDINSMYNIKKNRSNFTNSWINPEFYTNLTLQGANQIRQASKAKMFAWGVAADTNEMRIIRKIRDAANSVSKSYDESKMTFNVIIVLGVAGGTGSGGIIDIAQFVRRAVPVKCTITGYFYMPDTVLDFFRGKPAASNIQANGYAALKELDYYQSAQQRSTVDYLFVSDSKEEPISVDIHQPLYDTPILVCASSDAGNANGNKVALETISETIINLLAEAKNAQANVNQEDMYLMSSFYSNQQASRTAQWALLYDDNNKERSFTRGEDIFDYCAIGVGTASIPDQIVKCYAVQKMVRTISGRSDGFKVIGDFRGFALIPLTETEAKGKIKELLIDPESIVKKIVELAQIYWPEGFANAERKQILDGSQDIRLKEILRIDRKTQEVIKEINSYLDKVYENFLKKAEKFLIDYGPTAFVNIYKGVTEQSNYTGMDSLLTTYSGKRLDDFATSFVNTTQATFDLDDAKRNVKGLLRGTIGTAVQVWHSRFLEKNKAEVIESVIEHVFNVNGVYQTKVVDQIRRFADSCDDFAFALEKIMYAYEEMGYPFMSHSTFVEHATQSSAVNMNIIASETGYNWAKNIVDSCAQKVDFLKMKEELIKSFIQNPQKYTEYDTSRSSVSPRRSFDEIMAQYIDYGDQLSVVSYIQMQLEHGEDIDSTVGNIIDTVLVLAKPLYKQSKEISGLGSETKYLMVPEKLFITEGGNEIKNCFQRKCQEKGIQLFPSSITDKIVCYTFKAALPMYALSDLQRWQNAYDSAVRKMIHINESGEGIYSVETGLPWEDYPAIVLRDDVREENASGVLSREGQFLVDVFDPVIYRAMEVGVIEEKVNEKGEYCYIARILDGSFNSISFNENDYLSRDNEGYMQKGEPLFDYLAKQKKRSIADITVDVKLSNQGNFCQPHANRDEAKERAMRILRKNVPLYISVKNTISVVESVVEKIDAYNQKVKISKLRRLVPLYIASGILVRGEGNRWLLKDYPRKGSTEVIIRLVGAKVGDSLPYKAGLTYQVLTDYFFNEKAGDPLIWDFYKGNWDMITEAEMSPSDALARLSDFKEEVEDFLSKYVGSGKLLARKELIDSLNMSEDNFREEVEETYKCYKQTIAHIEELMIE